MKKDITSFEDIRLLVDSFYEKVRNDEVIGFLFDEVARVDWERHLPVTARQRALSIAMIMQMRIVGAGDTDPQQT